MPTRRALLAVSALLLIGGFLVLLGACAGSRGDVPSPVEATLTRVGQPAPAVSVVTIDGGAFSLAEQRGKVVLLNFWATWCPPCRQEFPHLRDEIWARHRDDDLVIVSVAREQTHEEVQRFLAEHDLGWTFAVDPERENFARYALAHIPRNYVIDRQGTIVFQSIGFEKDDFAELVAVIDQELARP